MGLFENILSKIAPEEPYDNVDEPDYTPEQATYIPRDPRTQDQTAATQPASPATTAAPRATQPISGGTNVMGAAIEMKVVKPDRFEMVAEIANLLLSGNTVLLNLEDTNKETTRRLIDFMTGVAYAINGDLRRIANNTYVVTPNNVRVSDSEETEGGAADSSDIL